MGLGIGWGCPSPSLSWTTSDAHLLYVPVMAALTHSDAILGPGRLCSSQLSTPLGHGCTQPTVELCHGTSGDWSRYLAQAGARARAVVGDQPESHEVSICFLCLVLEVNKCMCALYEWSLGFFSYSPLVSPIGFQTSKEDSSS